MFKYGYMNKSVFLIKWLSKVLIILHLNAGVKKFKHQEDILEHFEHSV